MECGVGISPLIKQRLQAEASNLNDMEKLCSIICDEMAIKERLLYNKEEDKFFGLVEAEGVYDEEIGQNPVLANKLLCFVIHGLSKKYTIPAAYFMVRALNGNELFFLVQQVIKVVEECGFYVLRLVTDNHRTNTSMFKKFGDGELKPSVVHPCNPLRQLYLSFDYCHLMKNIRSQFLDHDMADTDGIISAKFLKEVYRMQKNLVMKPVRYLTRKHLEPSSFEKMNVLHAVQVFSPAVSATLEYMKNNNFRLISQVDFSEAGPTVRFMKNVYKFFTVHDISDKTQHLRRNNPDSMMFYSPADERLRWLRDDFCKYIQEVQESSKALKMKGLTKETYDAIIFTVESTVSCIIHLLQSGFFYVLTRHFSGDPVEAMFSSVRMGGGSNDMTDSRTAQNAIKRILKSGLLISAANANVAHKQNSDICSKITSTEEDDTHSGTLIMLPEHINVLLESIRFPSMFVNVNLETATQALVCGYLVRVIEEKTECSSCVNNISIPATETPLMEMINHLDRGGLRYPQHQFVSLIIALQRFVEAALPYLKKSTCLLKTITQYVLPAMSQSPILKCSNEEDHQTIVAQLIVQKFVKPMLFNVGKKHTDRVFRFSNSVKPMSRKILKL